MCTPRSPKCLLCPLADGCAARRKGEPERLPARAPKKARPDRRCVMFWLENPKGEVLLRKRPENGLLGGMTELPSTPWREGDWPDDDEIAAHQPLQADWRQVEGEAVHVFTHFRLTIRLFVAKSRARANADGFWVRPEDFPDHALPTVIKKAVRLVGRTIRNP